MRRTKRVACLHQNDADAACFARLGSAAAAATRKSLGIRSQLPRGNRPGAQNGHDQCAKERCFDLLVHGGLLVQLPDGELAGLANVKLHMPMLVPGCVKTQVQPRILGQPLFEVQKPRQVLL